MEGLEMLRKKLFLTFVEQITALSSRVGEELERSLQIKARDLNIIE